MGASPLLVVFLAALSLGSVTAVSNLEYCYEVASAFRNTCPSAPTKPADSVEAMAGKNMSCGTYHGCFGTVQNGNCTWTRKLCVSCSQENSTAPVWMRVQSNGVPDHCYYIPRADNGSAVYMEYDFSVIFNINVSNVENTYTFEDQRDVDSVICNAATHSTVPESATFVQHGEADMESVVGISLNGVPIFNPNTANNVDPFYPEGWGSSAGQEFEPEEVDTCLIQADSSGVFNYQIMSPCWFNNNTNPQPCHIDCDPAESSIVGFPSTKETVVGVAKDGHVIYGPYDDKGHLVQPEQLDGCHGAHIDVITSESYDRYAYFASTTYPYFSGCFGPANYLLNLLPPSCTNNNPKPPAQNHTGNNSSSSESSGSTSSSEGYEPLPDLGGFGTDLDFTAGPMLATRVTKRSAPDTITINATLSKPGYMICGLSVGEEPPSVLDVFYDYVDFVSVGSTLDDDETKTPNITLYDLSYLDPGKYSIFCVAITEDLNITSGVAHGYEVLSCVGAASLGNCQPCFASTMCDAAHYCHDVLKLCVPLDACPNGTDCSSQCPNQGAHCAANDDLCQDDPSADPSRCTCGNKDFPDYWQAPQCCFAEANPCDVTGAPCFFNGQCDESNGQCIYTLLDEGAVCDDGVPETVGDTCDAYGYCSGYWVCESATCECTDSYTCEYIGCVWDDFSLTCGMPPANQSHAYALEIAQGVYEAYVEKTDSLLCCFSSVNEVKQRTNATVVREMDGFICDDPSGNGTYLVQFSASTIIDSGYLSIYDVAETHPGSFFAYVGTYVSPEEAFLLPSASEESKPQPFRIEDYHHLKLRGQHVTSNPDHPMEIPHDIVHIARTLHQGNISDYTHSRPMSRQGKMIQITYSSNFPANGRTAFQKAADTWEAILNPKQIIKIEVNWKPMGRSVLGNAGATNYFKDPKTGNYVVPALYWTLIGARKSDSADATVNMNSEFTWYFGTDFKTPNGLVDFLTVNLHELAHCFGFLGFADPTDQPTDGDNKAAWTPYDSQVITSGGKSITTLNDNDRAKALQGGDLYFKGSQAVAANGNKKVKLYTPMTWAPGSSYSHVDDDIFTSVDQLMEFSTPYGVGRGPGPVTKAMFADLGWPIASATPCSPNPCQNGGTCTVNGQSYTCKCLAGSFGSECQQVNPCAVSPCKNNGVCTAKGTAASCACINGYTGTNCETAPANPCNPNPCLSGGTCATSNGKAVCTCPAAYTGDRCQSSANPCTTNPCLNGGTCTNANGKAKCTCAAAYTGTTCATPKVCSPDPCNGGKCSLVNGAAKCSCASGRTGVSCSVVTPCTPNPCKNNGVCADSTGSAVCTCVGNWTGSTCEDSKLCNPNPCKNGGTCTFNAQNTGFKCACPAAFSASATCASALPCSTNPCKNGGDCVVSADKQSSTCNCKTGFVGATCETIDQCSPNPCVRGNCSTVNSKAVCTCPAGYTGPTCASTSAVCTSNPCQNGGSCTLINGSPTCTCTTGYSGPTCATLNPCAVVACQNGGSCSVASNGTAYCTCAAGWSGPVCSVNNGCIGTDCSNHGTCGLVSGVAICTCSKGYAGYTCSYSVSQSTVSRQDGAIGTILYTMMLEIAANQFNEYAFKTNIAAIAGVLASDVEVISTTSTTSKFRVLANSLGVQFRINNLDSSGQKTAEANIRANCGTNNATPCPTTTNVQSTCQGCSSSSGLSTGAIIGLAVGLGGGGLLLLLLLGAFMWHRSQRNADLATMDAHDLTKLEFAPGSTPNPTPGIRRG